MIILLAIITVVALYLIVGVVQNLWYKYKVYPKMVKDLEKRKAEEAKKLDKENE